LNAWKSGKKSFGLGFTPQWIHKNHHEMPIIGGIPYFQTDQYVDPFPFSLTLMLRTIMGHMFFFVREWTSFRFVMDGVYTCIYGHFNVENMIL
jgi:hypothetical protein